MRSSYIGRATVSRLFTSAIPLLLDTGTFACCVTTLGRYVPPGAHIDAELSADARST